MDRAVSASAVHRERAVFTERATREPPQKQNTAQELETKSSLHPHAALRLYRNPIFFFDRFMLPEGFDKDV